MFSGDKLRVLIAMSALLAATSLAWSADSPPAPATAATPALAPKKPVPPPAPPATALPFSWTGLYLRGTGGALLGDDQTSTNTLDGLLAGTPSAGATSGGMDSSEFSANWQTGDTVVGVAGDMQWSDQWTGPFGGCGLGCSLNDRVKVPWMATLRARAGQAFDRVFVYGTGGFATLGTADNLNAAGYGTAPNPIDFSTNNIDWTIGGGMEMALDHNMSAKIEYLYMPGGSAAGAAASLFAGSANDPAKNNILRGGIDYRLPIGDK